MEQLTNAIARIVSEDGDTTLGAAFFVGRLPNGSTAFMTCAHVVEARVTVRIVVLTNGRRVSVAASVHAVDEARDLAILCSDPNIPLLLHRWPMTSAWSLGGAVFSRGFQFRQFPDGYPVEGRVIGETSTASGDVLVLSGADLIDRGVSGAPAFSVDSQSFIGIITQKWRTKNTAHLIPMQDAASFASAQGISLLDEVAAGDTKKTRHAKNAVLPQTDLGPLLVHPYSLEDGFYGRKAEAGLLSRWVSDPEARIRVICAIGGMGKSALAWVWMRRQFLANGKSPRAVFWWSFADSSVSFSHFLRALYHYLHGADASVLDSEILSATTSALCTREVLIVLDSFESELFDYSEVQNKPTGQLGVDAGRRCVDPTAAKFLRAFATAPSTSRLLITSRVVPSEIDGRHGVTNLELRDLTADDAAEVLEARGIRATEELLRSIGYAHGFHPLSLRLICGLLENGGDVGQLTHLSQQDSLRHYRDLVLGMARASLSDRARSVANLLSAFVRPVSTASLLALSEVPSSEWPTIDRELRARGIIGGAKRGPLEMHPVVRQFFFDRIVAKTEIAGRIRDHYRGLPLGLDFSIGISAGPALNVDGAVELVHQTFRAGDALDAYDILNALWAPLSQQRDENRILCALLSLFSSGDFSVRPVLDSESFGTATVQLMDSFTSSGAPSAALQASEYYLRWSAELQPRVRPPDDSDKIIGFLMNKLSALRQGEISSQILERRATAFRLMGNMGAAIDCLSAARSEAVHNHRLGHIFEDMAIVMDHFEDFPRKWLCLIRAAIHYRRSAFLDTQHKFGLLGQIDAAWVDPFLRRWAKEDGRISMVDSLFLRKVGRRLSFWRRLAGLPMPFRAIVDVTVRELEEKLLGIIANARARSNAQFEVKAAVMLIRLRLLVRDYAAAEECIENALWIAERYEYSGAAVTILVLRARMLFSMREFAAARDAVSLALKRAGEVDASPACLKELAQLHRVLQAA